MIAFVFGPKAALNSSKSIVHSSHDLIPLPVGGCNGTNFGTPVLK